LPVVLGMRLSIRRSVTVALASGAAAVALAACGGSESGDNGKASAVDSAAGSGIVSKQSVGGTNVLVDAEGRTLYSAEVENGGRIRCTEACTSFWDPVGASANEADSASADLDLDLGVVKRPDGERQLTLEGRPLYTFTQEGPAELDGDGFVDDFEGTHFEWKAATTGGGSGPAGSDAPSDNSPY
jgi:predicted lipoprotein with Yx(FWY)xxD motif